MGDLTQEIKPPPPQVDTNVKPAAERGYDNRNKLLSNLNDISGIVTSVVKEQGGGYPNPFYSKAQTLIKLGDDYVTYLERNSGEIDDENIFNSIAKLAKSSMLLNIEYYVTEIRVISDYINQHPNLNNLNPPGIKDGPWSNIKEFLYYSSNNDVREEYREGIIAKAKDLIESGDFSPREVDHLERFLVDSQGRAPNQFIPEYIERNALSLKEWIPLSFENFQELVVAKLSDYQGPLSQNEYLRLLDEEIASIKNKDLPSSTSMKKVNFIDRSKKQAFTRDLRFGR